MKNTILKTIKIFMTILFGIILMPSLAKAMPPGAIVYRTSGEGKMFGYSGDPLIYSEKGIVRGVNSGHAGIYIGQENGVDYIVEALAGGIVKTPAANFVNLAEGEKYLGAKIPRGLSAIQQAKVVAIAKSLVGKKLAYDFDFKHQKGPGSGEWTCVGLTEKIYESANISNPNNLEALEYDPSYYALDITPDGYDSYSVVNSEGDCFSSKVEFSKIERRTNLIIPAPELIGYDLGLENNGERFIFLPYTQFLQTSLEDVSTDIPISSSFSGVEIRGAVPTAGLVLRWSLINNPLSSLKAIAQKAKEVVVNVSNKIFGTNSTNTNTEIVLVDNSQTKTPVVPVVKQGAVITKATTSVAVNTKKPVNNKVGSNPTPAKVGTQTKVINITKASSTNVKSSETKTTPTVAKIASSTKVTPTTKAASSTKVVRPSDASSTAVIASYFNPIVKPVKDSATGGGSGGGGGGSSSSAPTPVDNYPKIATINKIYSTGNNDWIELYNAGDRDFDLAAAGYRLEKAKTAADPSLIMRIGDADDGTYPGGTIIKAKSSYLIVKSTASNYYLAKASAIATREDFNWPGTGYTLFLGTAAISSITDPDIVEAVGFGADATYFQGSSPAPEITDNYVLSRVKNTNKNSADFELIKSDDPEIDWLKLSSESASTTDDVSTTTEDIATSTEDVASSTEDIATSSDDILTSTEDVSTSTEDVATSSGEVAPSGQAIINRIYATENNDWIELFNPTQYDLDLSLAEYRLAKTKMAAEPSLIMRIGDPLDGYYPGGTIIKSQDTYLIVRDEANDYNKIGADAIATRTDFSWDNSGYSLFLGEGPISSSIDDDIVDLVGYGSDATYWRGMGPAPAINNNYILARRSMSDNNNLDYNLLASDDPSINWSPSHGDNQSPSIYNFSPTAYDLYASPQPINSPGLVQLYHFDECNGIEARNSLEISTIAVNNRWLAGKFSCAQEAGSNFGNNRGLFNNPVDINNFSLSFWFKSTMTYPRLSLTLGSNSGDSINVTLENGLMQFSGLQSPEWRNYGDFPFDGTWRQATLVINRNEGYWSLYVDGIEKFHQDSYKIFAPMDWIEIGGDNGPYAIDELAIWSRALLLPEIISNRQTEAMFNPVILPEPQKIPVLKHFWNFNEGIGTTSVDLVSSANLSVDNNAWINMNVLDSAIVSSWSKSVNVNFPALTCSDLSLTFWWRNTDLYNDNRTRIALRSSSRENILTLIPSPYRTAYYFEGNYSYFDYGANLTIPYDLNWHLLALVYDSYRQVLRLYVDGVEKGARNFIWSQNRSLADGLEIVSENGISEIDDLGVWEGALSMMQIQQIFTNN